MQTQRCLLDNVLTRQECEELIFIHRSLSAVGYRSRVLSTTLFDVASAEPALLLPVVAAREKVRAAVEEAMACEYTLFVEFTGLLSWAPGASIDWHHDASRPYLQQRHVAAVAYLNEHGACFEGGQLCFQTGEPRCVLPSAGLVAAYLANGDNIHKVTPVEWGERSTLTLWFTMDNQYDEDIQLLRLLDQPLSSRVPDSIYQAPDGTDMRAERLREAGMSFEVDAPACVSKLAAGRLRVTGGCASKAHRSELGHNACCIVSCDSLQHATFLGMLACSSSVGHPVDEFPSISSASDTKGLQLVPAKERWQRYVASLQSKFAPALESWKQMRSVFVTW